MAQYCFLGYGGEIGGGIEIFKWEINDFLCFHPFTIHVIETFQMDYLENVM